MQPEERKLYVQVLGQMLIADGMLADSERAYLDGVMEKLGMSADERKDALRGISLDSPIEERIAGLGDGAKQELAAEIERAMGADAQKRGAEVALYERVKNALG